MADDQILNRVAFDSFSFRLPSGLPCCLALSLYVESDGGVFVIYEDALDYFPLDKDEVIVALASLIVTELRLDPAKIQWFEQVNWDDEVFFSRLSFRSWSRGAAGIVFERPQWHCRPDWEGSEADPYTYLNEVWQF